MSLDNHNEVGSSASDNSKIRRTFLKRASAVAVIATIPGRSAWAGIAGSIVASGHGSDFQQGQCTTLLSAESFTEGMYTNDKFIDIFGGNPFKMNGNVKPIINNNGKTPKYKIKSILEWDSVTDDVGNSTPKPNRKGIEDINLGLIVMYLNAKNHNNFGIFYPVSAQHGGDAAFANYLYNSALADPAGVGLLLSQTISNYSGSVC